MKQHAGWYIIYSWYIARNCLEYLFSWMNVPMITLHSNRIYSSKNPNFEISKLQKEVSTNPWRKLRVALKNFIYQGCLWEIIDIDIDSPDNTAHIIKLISQATVTKREISSFSWSIFVFVNIMVWYIMFWTAEFIYPESWVAGKTL